ncbi:MAG: undecaprenyl-diphosphate phosphatase [Defluviitaleaceae bacterium]|nr:undecaprenyl-diphosphate phosphatase [Defluviitaleaceae bacterium]
MSILHAIILGIVQGITEFLPISSSGHLIVLQRVFGIEEPLLTFDIAVHVGSLAAILIVFWPDVWGIIKNPLGRMTGLLIIGSIPAVVLGFIFHQFGIIENNFRTGIWLAAAFTLTGVLLLFADRFTAGTKEERDITWFDALFVGVCQALAIPPGISRSGTTITGALTRGINRKTAATFSFMLAIIAIAGGGLLEAVSIARGSESVAYTGLVNILVGMAVSAAVGYLSIKLLLKLIHACKLRYFSFYLWGLALLIFADWLVFNHFF